MLAQNPELSREAIKKLLIKYYSANRNLNSAIARTYYANLTVVDEEMSQQLIEFYMNEIQFAFISVVIDELPSTMQKYMYLRYKKGLSFRAITLELFISKSQLHKWNNVIYAKIRETLTWQISTSDIFARIKIINMLEIIGTTLQVLKKYDGAHIHVSPSFCHMLEFNYLKYHILFESITTCERIVKLKSNALSLKEIASICGVSISTISRKIKSYRISLHAHLKTCDSTNVHREKPRTLLSK